RCMKLAPRKPEVWSNVGLCLMETGKFKDAREAFRRAIALDPKPDYMPNVAAAYSMDGNYVEATRWCKRALEKAPEHSAAHGTLGFAMLAGGDWAGWKHYDYTLGGKFRQGERLGDAAHL